MEKIIYNHTFLSDLLSRLENLLKSSFPENATLFRGEQVVEDFLWEVGGDIEHANELLANGRPDLISPDLAYGLIYAHMEMLRFSDHLLQEDSLKTLKRDLENIISLHSPILVGTLLTNYDFDLEQWESSLEDLKSDLIEDDDDMFMTELQMIYQADQLDLVLAFLEKYTANCRLNPRQINALQNLKQSSEIVNQLIKKSAHEFIDAKYWTASRVKAMSENSSDLKPELLPSLNKYENLLLSAIDQAEDESEEIQSDSEPNEKSLPSSTIDNLRDLISDSTKKKLLN